MLKLTRLELSIAVIFLYPITHAESATNKCTDGSQVTYANMPCEKLGLQSVGPVRNAVTIVPAPPKPKKNLSENVAKEGSEEGEVPDVDVDDAARAKKIQPVNPLIKKLLE